MINYSSFLREKLKSPNSQWNIYEHPNFTSACKEIQQTQNLKNKGSKRQILKQSRTTPLKKPKVDLVSCYNTVMQLSKKQPQTKYKLPKRHSLGQYCSIFGSKNHLQTIQQRLISEQDKDPQSNIKAKSSSCQIKERQSTTASLKKKERVLSVNSPGITPFTTSLGKIKVCIDNTKIQLDVSKLILNKGRDCSQKMKQTNTKLKSYKYFSR